MNATPELDSHEPASKAEKTALLIEVINISLYGPQDPWNTESLIDESLIEFPDLEKGHQAEATHTRTGDIVRCKYDPMAKEDLLLGSGQKVHLASLHLDSAVYDFFASTTRTHDSDVLGRLFDLLENNMGSDEIGLARGLDLVDLPDDFEIEVFEGLPQHGHLLKALGELGLEFANFIEDDNEKTYMIASAEELQVESRQARISADLEKELAVNVLDGSSARKLAHTLRNDCEAIPRY